MNLSFASQKRMVDVLFSCVGLVIAFPPLALAAIAILVESGWPVLFRQVRVGRHFQPFHILKLRTMRTDRLGPTVTSDGDRRITNVGRVLRKIKLDEIPQFWNVLRGEMSIVGPRPEVAEYVTLFESRYRQILTVRPGITDLASIRYRNEELELGRSKDPLREYRERILPAKLDLAERYVREQSLLTDFAIIWQTAIATVCSTPRH
jgi:lipopolysaccharide/colanic/teichoic acid biosynthesis glycosyltransferase